MPLPLTYLFHILIEREKPASVAAFPAPAGQFFARLRAEILPLLGFPGDVDVVTKGAVLRTPNALAWEGPEPFTLRAGRWSKRRR